MAPVKLIDISKEKVTLRSKALLAILLAGVSLCAVAPAQSGNSYQVTNLISDGSVAATTTDPHLINPWGIGIGSTIWISGENSGLEFVSTATGAEKVDLNLPAASGSGTGLWQGARHDDVAHPIAVSPFRRRSFSTQFASITASV